MCPPSDWDVIELGTLVEKGLLSLRAGYAQGSHNQAGEGVPHLRPFNVSEHGVIDLTAIKFVTPPDVDSPHWLQKGDVLFNNTNSEDLTGKTAFLESDLRCTASNHMTILRVVDVSVLDPYWLAAYLHHLWRSGVFKLMLRRYVGQATVSLTRLSALDLTLPSLSEQRAMARVLSAVQRAKEQTEQVIAAAGHFKRSLANHLFSFGAVRLREAPSVEVRESEVGTVPTHWSVLRMTDIQASTKYAISAGPFGSRLGRRDYVQSGVPVIRGVNLAPSGTFSSEGLVFVSENKADDLVSSNAFPGDVIVTQRGTLGQVGLVPKESPYARFVLSQSQMKVTPARDRALPEYLYHALQTPNALKRLLESATKTGVPHINLGILRNFRVPIPPHREQDSIVTILHAVDKKVRSEEQRRDALDQLFKSLLHELMSGRIRLTDWPDVA